MTRFQTKCNHRHHNRVVFSGARTFLSNDPRPLSSRPDPFRNSAFTSFATRGSPILEEMVVLHTVKLLTRVALSALHYDWLSPCSYCAGCRGFIPSRWRASMGAWSDVRLVLFCHARVHRSHLGSLYKNDPVHGVVSLDASPFKFRASRCDARAL